MCTIIWSWYMFQTWLWQLCNFQMCTIIYLKQKTFQSQPQQLCNHWMCTIIYLKLIDISKPMPQTWCCWWNNFHRYICYSSYANRGFLGILWHQYSHPTIPTGQHIVWNKLLPSKWEYWSVFGSSQWNDFLIILLQSRLYIIWGECFESTY